MDAGGVRFRTMKKPITSSRLLRDLRGLILEAQQVVARQVDSPLVMIYWHTGERIQRDILKQKRAEYGERIVAALSQQLSVEFEQRFGLRNLFQMIRFAKVFPDPQIVQSLIAHLGWTHFLQLIHLDDPLKRDFFTEICRIERWNTRTMDKKIQSSPFERELHEAVRLACARLAAQRHGTDAKTITTTQDRIDRPRALPRGKR